MPAQGGNVTMWGFTYSREGEEPKTVKFETKGEANRERHAIGWSTCDTNGPHYKCSEVIEMNEEDEQS